MRGKGGGGVGKAEGEGGKRRIRRARKDAATLGVEHMKKHTGVGAVKLEK